MSAAALRAGSPVACPAEIGAERIGRLAVQSLYHELALYPKPGLVSPRDSGSHADMDVSTFYRSLFALRHYFQAIAAAGRRGADFAELQALGLQAEARMLGATGGINTHRGAVFNLGLLCAAAGALAAGARRLDADAVCRHVAERWGAPIRLAAARAAGRASHGTIVRRRYGAGGAREEAARGFPSVRALALPALRRARADTDEARQRAALDALFALIAELEDSNLLWRGGPQGLAFARAQARAFLDAGGADAPDGLRRAQAVHARFVARRLSPGGSADLLAAALFLDGAERGSAGAAARAAPPGGAVRP